MMTKKRRSPEEYLSQPYMRLLMPDQETNTYTAEIVEFPGCISQGDNPQEAYERLEQTAKSWIEAALEMGQEIPNPLSIHEFGGKVLLRLPKSVHRQTTLASEKEGVSVNQFILSAISEKLGASKLYDKLAERIEQRYERVAFDLVRLISSAPNKGISSLGIQSLNKVASNSPLGYKPTYEH